MRPMLVLIAGATALIALGGRPSPTPGTPTPEATSREEPPSPPAAAPSPPIVPVPAPAPPSALESPVGAPPEIDANRPASRPSSPGGLIQAFADGFHGLIKPADRMAQEQLALGEEEERRQGARLYREILKREKVWTSSQALRRVEELARPLLERRTRRGIEYTFTLLDDPKVNAFSIAGGYIFVNRGLIERAKTDAEIQFVLGHEIAHVDLGHCARLLTYRARAQEIGGEAAGLLASLTYGAIALGFSEELELESDAWSYRSLISMGRSHEESLAFLRDLEAEEKRKSDSTDQPGLEDVAGTLGRVVGDHFASHPPTALRIDRLEALGRGNPVGFGAAPTAR